MEKSIETIWKEGFLEKNALVAPKINDLYNKKSRHVIEKFKRLGKANLIGIVVGAAVILGYAIMAGVPIIGSLIAATLMWIVLVGMRQSKVLSQITTNKTSYQYLQDFDHWLQDTINTYGRVYKLAYPMLFLLIMLGTLYGNLNGDSRLSIIEEISQSPEVTMIFGMPLVVIIPLVLIALLSSIFSAKIYKLDIDLLYGHVLRKIEELLKDMEDLTASQ